MYGFCVFQGNDFTRSDADCTRAVQAFPSRAHAKGSRYLAVHIHTYLHRLYTHTLYIHKFTNSNETNTRARLQCSHGSAHII